MNRPRYSVRWALLGLILSIGAPIGLKLVAVITAQLRAATMPWAYVYTSLSTALVFTLFGMFAGRLADRRSADAVRDGLTGLYNRRYLHLTVDNLRASAARQDAGVAVLVVDLDHFKRVNDTYGHLIGDQALCAVANCLRDTVRASDLLVRFGGEEFVVACVEADAHTAEDVAERLRSNVEALEPEVLGFPGRQTISVGVARVGERERFEDAVHRADEALYRAKESGRNRVETAKGS